MLTQTNYQNFDVNTVSLSGSNLIEASAGTGKTYSIAILVLRLILEEKISITKILMVTFTKAAVAELEERIRLFVRNANRYAHGEEIEDKQIKALVAKAMSSDGKDEVQRLLNSAVLNLDETSVLTIHSFCQQTLNEFAFETNQLFHAELVQDLNPIIEEEIQQFWRRNITVIRPDLLHSLIEINLNHGGILAIVREHLNGKLYFSFDPKKSYHFGPEKQVEFLETIKLSKEKKEEAEVDILDYLCKNVEELRGLCASNRYAKSALLHLVDQPGEFLKTVREKSGSNYVQQLFPNLLEKIEVADEAAEDYKNDTENCLDYLYSFAIQEIIKGIRKFKLSNNQMGFDDLIANLHKALVERKNPTLEGLLKEKYQAVFIDEFQDTDKQQYEIFKKAFQGKSILFYIGDPKQSIYAWRKADIATYFKARQDVDHLYSMNTNYRSTKPMIDAMNRFFLPPVAEGQFDTFHYLEAKDRIDYHPVDAPKNSEKGQLTLNGVEDAPITITETSNKTVIAEATAQQCLDLLINSEHSIFDKETKQQRNISPSDIGILVRSKKDGLDVKNQLARLGIPAVTVTDAKVLESDEALQLLYVLDAIINNTRSKINRALLSTFTNWKTEEIFQLNEEVIIQKFREYKEKWRLHGIYAALMDFITDFEIQQKLIAAPTENGERILTNLYHLLEILYKTESRQHLNPVELLDWLKRSLTKASEGDEMEQRIENDEEAIKIVTIHSSKGLEYPIVMAPYLDFTYYARDFISFRDEKTGEYKVANRKQLSEEQIADHLRQEEQENRRLLYVAITRAVYKCFIFKNGSSKANNSTLSAFYKTLEYDELIKKETGDFDHEGIRYQVEEAKEQKPLLATSFQLSGNNWLRMSYSKLAARHETSLKERYQAEKEGYDYFIFQELKKGTKTGNFLHFIFENLDFTKAEQWNFVLKRAMNRFLPSSTEGFEKNMHELLYHVFQARLSTEETTFQLSSIPVEQCIHELEFDFPVSLFTPTALTTLLEAGIAVTDKIWSQVEGIMNGKIDLFFQYGEKYYVLDWKSTYLGPQVDNYAPELLSEAMDENNYHLQYLIYTLAVKKYLESRLGSRFNYEQNFGGIFYLFVRGMRADDDSGVYYNRPSVEQIMSIERILRNELVEI